MANRYEDSVCTKPIEAGPYYNEMWRTITPKLFFCLSNNILTKHKMHLYRVIVTFKKLMAILNGLTAQVVRRSLLVEWRRQKNTLGGGRK